MLKLCRSERICESGRKWSRWDICPASSCGIASILPFWTQCQPFFLVTLPDEVVWAVAGWKLASGFHGDSVVSSLALFPVLRG